MSSHLCVCPAPPRQYADSDQAIFYQADGGSLVEIDNPGDDREKNQDDEYTVDWAHNTFSIVTQSTDGWCIDSITYGSLSVDLSNQQKSGVWLDKPCSGWDYARPHVIRDNACGPRRPAPQTGQGGPKRPRVAVL